MALGGCLNEGVSPKADWIYMVGPWHFDLNEAWYLYKRPGALKQAFQVAHRPPEPRNQLKKLKKAQFVW